MLFSRVNRKWQIRIRIIITVCLATLILPSCQTTEVNKTPQLSSRFTLWQLPSQTASQINSYVLQTNNDSVIVIDGGVSADAPFLKDFLANLGNHVKIWFISHPHPDHIDALTAILKKTDDLHIDRICASLPTEEWVAQYEPEYLQSLAVFNQALRDSHQQAEELSLGQTIEIDGICFEIIGIKNPEITTNPGNNSSVVMRVRDRHKTVLFTGDLGVEGGEKLLKGPYRDRLKADYVQMAHHGQNGVTEAFYIAVSPKYCLWPTPLWLWNNDSGSGVNTGQFKTFEVRQWMKKLNVQKHYIAAFGIQRID